MCVLFVLILGCQTMPVPMPSVLVAADRDTLHNPTYLRFKGKLYVLGGYYEKQVPHEYVFWVFAYPFSSEQSTGMQYEKIEVPNTRIFEITDTKEAFLIESSFAADKWPAFIIQPGTWKDIGKIPFAEVIRDPQYYLEFNAHLYVVGGTRVVAKVLNMRMSG